MSIIGWVRKRATNSQIFSLNFTFHKKWNSKNVKIATNILFAILFTNFYISILKYNFFNLQDILIKMIHILFPYVKN